MCEHQQNYCSWLIGCVPFLHSNEASTLGLDMSDITRDDSQKALFYHSKQNRKVSQVGRVDSDSAFLIVNATICLVLMQESSQVP